MGGTNNDKNHTPRAADENPWRGRLRARPVATVASNTTVGAGNAQSAARQAKKRKVNGADNNSPPAQTAQRPQFGGLIRAQTYATRHNQPAPAPPSRPETRRPHIIADVQNESEDIDDNEDDDEDEDEDESEDENEDHDQEMGEQGAAIITRHHPGLYSPQGAPGPRDYIYHNRDEEDDDDKEKMAVKQELKTEDDEIKKEYKDEEVKKEEEE